MHISSAGGHVSNGLMEKIKSALLKTLLCTEIINNSVWCLQCSLASRKLDMQQICVKQMKDIQNGTGVFEDPFRP
jgi:hypothetical protein